MVNDTLADALPCPTLRAADEHGSVITPAGRSPASTANHGVQVWTTVHAPRHA